MRLARAHSLNEGAGVWQSLNEYAWLISVFNAPSLEIDSRSGRSIRSHVDREFAVRGWAMDCKIDPASNLKVTAKHRGLAFQVQTGNVGRAAYDLLKLQHLFHSGAVDAVALAVPTKEAAGIIGSNIANGERLWAEMQLFREQLTAPFVMVEFE